MYDCTVILTDGTELYYPIVWFQKGYLECCTDKEQHLYPFHAVKKVIQKRENKI